MAVQSTDINFRYFMFSKEDYDKKTEIEKKAGNNYKFGTVMIDRKLRKGFLI